VRRMVLDAAAISLLAKTLIVDRRSIVAEMQGRFVRGRAGERIRAALAALKLNNPNTPKPPTGPIVGAMAE